MAKRHNRNRREEAADQDTADRDQAITATAGREASAKEGPPADAVVWTRELPTLVIGGALLMGVFAWAYWPTLVGLVTAWDRTPDYSHGYFVFPLSLFFLYVRRDRFPGLGSGLGWAGLILMALSVAMRIGSAHYYLEAADGWSILLWVAGVVWLLGGWKIFLWCLPSIAFLFFMIPLPFRVERWLSGPLQAIATKLSCSVLQVLGQPALSEGTTILLGDHQLEVEQACSGLRIFVGIVALAFAYVIIVRRPWWEKVLLILSVAPIAVIANSTRIVGTGLLYQLVSGEAAEKFTHDIAGYVMIPFAAALFAAVLWYLGRLMREVEVADVGTVVRRERVQL